MSQEKQDNLNQEKRLEAPLLTDEQFASLMIEQFETDKVQTSPEMQEESERIWSSLEDKLFADSQLQAKPKRQMTALRKQFSLGFAAVLAVACAFFFYVKPAFVDDGSRIKGAGLHPITVEPWVISGHFREAASEEHFSKSGQYLFKAVEAPTRGVGFFTVFSKSKNGRFKSQVFERFDNHQLQAEYLISEEGYLAYATAADHHETYACLFLVSPGQNAKKVQGLVSNPTTLEKAGQLQNCIQIKK